MKKYLMLLLMLLGVILSASAYEKASNKFANNSKTIALDNCSGYDKNGLVSDDYFIQIIDFLSDRWIVAFVDDDGVFLSGELKLGSPDALYIGHKSDDYASFSGTIVNQQNGETLECIIRVTDDIIVFCFYDTDMTSNVDLPAITYAIEKESIENSGSKIYFHEWRNPMGDFGWKEGSLKQLRKCLSQNPYIRKF